MRKVIRPFGAIILALYAVATAAAVPVSVSYVEGSVQVQSGGTWKNLDFGDSFDSAQTVRLGAKAILELSVRGGATVVISSAGNYVVDTLLRPRQESSALANVAGKLERLAQSGARQESSVAGVRGSSVDASSLMWAGAGVEAEAAFEAARKAAQEGRLAEAWTGYMEARELYDEAADAAGAARSAWHASLAALAQGSGGKALAALRSARADDAGALRGQYVLALATLNARFGNPSEAKALLDAALARAWFDDPTMLADAQALAKALAP